MQSNKLVLIFRSNVLLTNVSFAFPLFFLPISAAIGIPFAIVLSKVDKSGFTPNSYEFPMYHFSMQM